MMQDLFCLREPSVEDDCAEEMTNPATDLQSIVSSRSSSYTTVFPFDIAFCKKCDKDQTCQDFLCKLAEESICRNSYAAVSNHPCSHRACEFYGNCYACIREQCDNKGKYMLADKTSRLI